MNFVRDHTSDEVNTLVTTLSHHHRRETLSILRETDRPLALADLAITLARRQAVGCGMVEAKRQAEQLQIELYHCHVPKLEAAGLVAYDSERSVVGLTESGRDEAIIDAEAELTVLS